MSSPKDLADGMSQVKLDEQEDPHFAALLASNHRLRAALDTLTTNSQSLMAAYNRLKDTLASLQAGMTHYKAEAEQNYKKLDDMETQYVKAALVKDKLENRILDLEQENYALKKEVKELKQRKKAMKASMKLQEAVGARVCPECEKKKEGDGQN